MVQQSTQSHNPSTIITKQQSNLFWLRNSQHIIKISRNPKRSNNHIPSNKTRGDRFIRLLQPPAKRDILILNTKEVITYTLRCICVYCFFAMLPSFTAQIKCVFFSWIGFLFTCGTTTEAPLETDIAKSVC